MRDSLLAGCPVGPEWMDGKCPGWEAAEAYMAQHYSPAIRVKMAPDGGRRVMSFGGHLWRMQAPLESNWERVTSADEIAEKLHYRILHLHADHDLDGHAVHIDQMRLNASDPMRVRNEYRVYLDGALRGRALWIASSLGAGRVEVPKAVPVNGRLMLLLEKFRGYFGEDDLITVWERVGPEALAYRIYDFTGIGGWDPVAFCRRLVREIPAHLLREDADEATVRESVTELVPYLEGQALDETGIANQIRAWSLMHLISPILRDVTWFFSGSADELREKDKREAAVLEEFRAAVLRALEQPKRKAKHAI